MLPANGVRVYLALGATDMRKAIDALGEGIPGHDRLDSGEWIAAPLLGFDQRLTNATEQAHFGIYRLAGCLELLLVLLLGIIEQLRRRCSAE
ncbi:Mobile element protein [Desulfovibrio sp. TomC]|nr:Mobile element protein [Desulfovibrio sp. TomC]